MLKKSFEILIIIVILSFCTILSVSAAAATNESSGNVAGASNSNANSGSQLNNLTVSDVLAGSGQAYDTLKKLWGKQNLLDLLSGKLAIPDEVTNDYITQVIQAGNVSKSISSVKINTHPDNKLVFTVVDTSVGTPVVIKADIKNIVFDAIKQQGYMAFFTSDVALEDPSVFGWMKNLFVRCYSFGTLCNMFGTDMDYGPDVKMTADGDNVTIDFYNQIMNSQFAQMEIYGVKLVNQVKITGFTTDEGVLYLYVDLGLGSSIKNILLNFVS